MAISTHIDDVVKLRNLPQLSMIFLTLVCLALRSSFALSLPPSVPADIPPSSVFTRTGDIFDTRSIWGIIWSCLSTIFACTWIAVHPNIPAPKDTQWAVLRRRMAIMVYALIIPEIIVLWAARQRHGARHYAKKHQRRGWTMAHGFFLIMGGFTLHDEQGTALRILVPTELERLSDAGKIEWPLVTEQEIQDRSKGDYLSKGIVLMHTFWFITQAIVRGAYRLGVTEFEIATLAFTALTGATYYHWWHKPLDVRCSVPVYLLNENIQKRVSSSPAANPLPVLQSPISCNPTEASDSKQVQVASQFPIGEETQMQVLPVTVVISPNPEPSSRGPSTSNPTQTPSHNNSTEKRGMGAATGFASYFTQVNRFSSFTQRQRQKKGILVSLLAPLLALFAALSDAATSHTLNHSVPLRMPTFYSPKIIDAEMEFVSIYTAGFVAYAFGGIHCVAWSFHFPSPQERLAWRISALSVFLLIYTAAGISYIGFIVPPRLGKYFGALMVPMAIAYIIVYLIARITLVILACITLRALPPAAFVEVQWSSFFPHIN